MNIKSITIACGLLLGLPLWAQSPQMLIGLDELFSLADSQSKTIKIYESAVEVAEKNIDAAKTAYLPNVDLSVSATYNGNAWVSNRDFSNGQTFSSPHFGNSFAVEASQTVFAGGAIHFRIDALKTQRSISEWSLAAHRQETYFLLAGYYLDLYKCRNLLTVYDRNIAQTKQVIADMRAREAVGIVLPNDITRYEAQLQGLNYGRTELKSSISIANSRLVTMLELPANTEIIPDTTLLTLNLPRPASADLQQTASELSPSLNIGRLSLDLLDKQVRVAQSAYWPHVSIIAGDNLKGPITYEIPTLNNNINTWYVGVGLRYSLGSLYKAPKDLAALRATIAQKQYELAQAEERVELDVNDAYTRYLDSFELLETQRKSLELACENYQVVANRYANGLALVTDLVDADNLRLSAEAQYVNAQINIIYNYYRLLYASGLIQLSQAKVEV